MHIQTCFSHFFSAKIVLYLNHPKGPKSEGPVFHKKYDFMKLSFRKGGKDEVSNTIVVV